MTLKELRELHFDEAARSLMDEGAVITTYEDLKQFALENIAEDKLFLAAHILQALNEHPAYYYDYDYCMGTLDTPSPLEDTVDLEYYCEDY